MEIIHIKNNQPYAYKYNQYIDNQEIKDEIRDLKKKIASNEDILDYYCKYHRLNDFLDEITKVVFGGN